MPELDPSPALLVAEAPPTSPALRREASSHSTLSGYQECLREAMNCLESSNRRLRRGGPEQTDEALALLFSATGHLRAAVAPNSGR